jgi:hypothetical protein
VEASAPAPTHLCLEQALAVLQLSDAGGALRQHGLLLLQGPLELQGLLCGGLTHQSGATELLLQAGDLVGGRGHRVRMDTRRVWFRVGFVC